MKLIKAIEHKKQQLIQKYQKNGLYENFGQAEVRKLENKYINISIYNKEMNNNRNILLDFDNWCSLFNGQIK